MEKERAMHQRQSAGRTAVVAKINAGLSPTPQPDLERMGRRNGRALGKYPAAATGGQARGQSDPAGRAVGLQIASDMATGPKARRRKGA